MIRITMPHQGVFPTNNNDMRRRNLRVAAARHRSFAGGVSLHTLCGVPPHFFRDDDSIS